MRRTQEVGGNYSIAIPFRVLWFGVPVFLICMCLAGCADQAGPTQATVAPAQEGPPRDRDGIDLRIDPNLDFEARLNMQEALDRGASFERMDLLEAIRKGRIVATASGEGLQSAAIHFELKFDCVLAVDIAPTTFLGSKSSNVQNMVVLESATVWLWPDMRKQSISVAVACANMPRDAPEGSDELVVQPLPSKGTVHWADLRKLITCPEFAAEEGVDQQFAVWTITENPASPGAYTAIQVSSTAPGGYSLPPSSRGPDLEAILALLKKAGIDPMRYAVFRDSSAEPQVPAELEWDIRLEQVEYSRHEAEAAILEQANAARLTDEQAREMVREAERPRRLNEVRMAMLRAREAMHERMAAQRDAYHEAKARGEWEDKAVQAGEERARPLAQVEAAARAEAEALYELWQEHLSPQFRE